MPDANLGQANKFQQPIVADSNQIARSIFGKPLQSVQAPKRPDNLKNGGAMDYA